MDCSLARLVFTIRLLGTPSPYAFYSLRTPFQDAFRAFACRGTGDGVCERCRFPDCPFYRVFSQKVADDPEGKKRHQKPPLPFVFGFPTLNDRDRDFAVSLTIVGSALPYIDLFVEAFRRVLGDGDVRAEIIGIASTSRFGEKSPLYPVAGGMSQPVLLAIEDFLRESPPGERGKITFESPLRLVSNGREINSFDFPLLLRSLLRRVSSMLYYYCGVTIDDDFRWLSARCADIAVTSERFSSDRSSGGIPGVSGSAEFRGALSEIYPYLLLGEYLGAGKGAPFGFGRYRLSMA